jgi:epoxyqueuosine reductase
MTSLESRIKEQAHALGFELVGIAPATPADGFDHMREWLDRGYAGEMGYMHRQAEARRHPDSILPEVRSVVMVGMNYKPAASDQSPAVENEDRETRRQGDKENGIAFSIPPCLPVSESGLLATSHRPLATARVARYARGDDYHVVLWKKLNELLVWIQREVPGCRGRGVVDTAPLMERDFARRAGLGWFGKNTMLLNKQLGSYFFLGALLLDIDLAPDPPHDASHCGTCTACLDACPTKAFVEPGVLDSRQCISYLTIELRGPIPENLREPMGDWLFGCDVCQEVCPWNRKAPPGMEPALKQRDDLTAIDLLELLSISEEQFRLRYRGTALMRTKRQGLLRNAAIVLGNQGDTAALPALRHALTDPDPVIREAAQWAIQKIQESEVRSQRSEIQN